jgi:hypothetical protein
VEGDAFLRHDPGHHAVALGAGVGEIELAAGLVALLAQDAEVELETGELGIGGLPRGDDGALRLLELDRRLLCHDFRGAQRLLRDQALDPQLLLLLEAIAGDRGFELLRLHPALEARGLGLESESGLSLLVGLLRQAIFEARQIEARRRGVEDDDLVAGRNRLARALDDPLDSRIDRTGEGALQRRHRVARGLHHRLDRTALDARGAQRFASHRGAEPGGEEDKEQNEECRGSAGDRPASKAEVAKQFRVESAIHGDQGSSQAPCHDASD